jgi:hypothetical protein
MPRVHESDLYKNGWTTGVLEYVEMFRNLHATEAVTEEALAEALSDRLSKGVTAITCGMAPYLGARSLQRPFSVVVGIRIQVDGHEHIGLCVVSFSGPLRQRNCRIVRPGLYDVKRITLQRGRELKYDLKRNVFLPVRSEHRTRVSAPMPRIKADEKLSRLSGGRGCV